MTTSWLARVRRAIGALWLTVACVAYAQPGAQDVLEARLKRLETDLRCLVCQNQTLADSDAPLAMDLRREIRQLALAGRSDADIRAFLVERYGDFVLYTPPLKPSTWLLWLGPFGLLLAGAAVWWSVLRRRARLRTADTPAPSTAAEARARELLRGG
jgi:cytochrome c-type biogenesis protein CcmH